MPLVVSWVSLRESVAVMSKMGGIEFCSHAFSCYHFLSFGILSQLGLSFTYEDSIGSNAALVVLYDHGIGATLCIIGRVLVHSGLDSDFPRSCY